MKVRDLILVIYGVAILAILLDVAVQVRRSETFRPDTLVSKPVWTVEV